MHYLTCTRLDILFRVGLDYQSSYGSTNGNSHDYHLYCSPSKNFKLIRYSDRDQGGDLGDKKKSPSLCFFKRNAAFTWTSKKQPIVTLLNCEAEVVSTTSFVCHIIWSKNLLKYFNLPLEDQHNYGNISRYLISYPQAIRVYAILPKASLDLSTTKIVAILL